MVAIKTEYGLTIEHAVVFTQHGKEYGFVDDHLRDQILETFGAEDAATWLQEHGGYMVEANWMNDAFIRLRGVEVKSFPCRSSAFGYSTLDLVEAEVITYVSSMITLSSLPVTADIGIVAVRR